VSSDRYSHLVQSRKWNFQFFSPSTHWKAIELYYSFNLIGEVLGMYCLRLFIQHNTYTWCCQNIGAFLLIADSVFHRGLTVKFKEELSHLRERSGRSLTTVYTTSSHAVCSSPSPVWSHRCSCIVYHPNSILFYSNSEFSYLYSEIFMCNTYMSVICRLLFIAGGSAELVVVTMLKNSVL